MSAAFSKAHIESQVAARFGDAFRQHEKRAAEFLSTGIASFDAVHGGLPRGAISEVVGPASSGRTSFMLSALSHATNHDEICALIDTNNVFDPCVSTHAGTNLDRLLWIRANHNLEHAFKATDLLLQAGGFGLVFLDLGDVAGQSAKRIISSWWFRFRRTLEATPTVLMVIAEQSCVGSRAALGLELKKENDVWNSPHGNEPLPFVQPGSWQNLSSRILRRQTLPHSNVLTRLSFRVECTRPLYLKTAGELRLEATR